MLTKQQAELLLLAINALMADGGEECCDALDKLGEVDDADLVDALFALHKIAYGVDLGEARRVVP